MKNLFLAELTVDFDSTLPVYEPLKKNIKQAIARNIIQENQTLPSIRDLAAFLKINPNTVARAYRDLTQVLRQFKDSGTVEDTLQVLADPAIPYSEVVATMDAARTDGKTALFPGIQLALALP